MTKYKFLFLAFFIIFSFTVSAKTIRYVKVNGTGDGSSWNNASNNIQYMIDDSAIGDEIWVSEGTFSPINSSQFKFNKNGVVLYGGFAGNETNISQRRVADLNQDGKTDSFEFINRTILKTITDDYQVIKCDAGTTLNGFYITGGKANIANAAFQSSGGGIYASSSTITNCTISDCYAIVNGGGIYARDSKIMNCLVTNCNAYKDGGGIYVRNSSVINCYISECNSVNGSGGGIYSDNSIIENSVISKCTAGADGGGLSSIGISSSVYNCNISDCTAGYYGGGIYGHNISNCTVFKCSSNSGGGICTDTYTNTTTSVISSNIINCKATINGGGIYISPTEGTSNFKIEVSYCDVIDCIAGTYGGGICTELPGVNSSFSYTKNYFPQIAFCSIKGCSSTRGGGIFAVHKVGFCNVSNSTATEYGGGIYAPYSSTVINCTVTNCSTNGSGGGIYAQSIANCVIANCSAVTWGGVKANALNINSINNAISNNMTNGRVSSGVSFSEGYFSPVITDAYIHPTSFIGVATTDEQKQELISANWSLKEGSPCINIGDATNIVDNKSVIAYGIIDIGAFEYNVPIVNMPAVENFDNIADWNSSPVFYNSAQLNGLQNIVWNILNQKATFSRTTNFVSSYSQPIFTYQIDGTKSTKVYLSYDMYFQAYAGTITPLGTEKLNVEFSTDLITWRTIATYTNANGTIGNNNYKHNISTLAGGKTFFIRFNANGANSNRIEKWEIDNVIINTDGLSAVNLVHENKYKYSVNNGVLYVDNLGQGAIIQLFNTNGMLLANKVESHTFNFSLPIHGVYIVKVASDLGVENKKIVW